jgi:uncharacterized membrane protein YgcG
VAGADGVLGRFGPSPAALAHRSAGARAAAAEEEIEEGEAGDEKAGAEEEGAAPTTKSTSGHIGNGGALAYDDLVIALVDALAALAALAAETAAQTAAETAAPDSNLVAVSCAAVAAAFAQGAGYGPSGLTKGLLERCDGRHARTTKPARLLETLPGVVRYTCYVFVCVSSSLCVCDGVSRRFRSALFIANSFNFAVSLSLPFSIVLSRQIQVRCDWASATDRSLESGMLWLNPNADFQALLFAAVGDRRSSPGKKKKSDFKGGKGKGKGGGGKGGGGKGGKGRRKKNLAAEA